ncbi:MAG TPA: hypothetical protein VMN81_01135 [Vicinamibacterales bacterium]|nr:hypothetical protein [Vicinamibacterales bacterium]
MEQQNPTVEQLANRKQVLRGEDSAPIYYANYFGVLATKGDVRLRVGQVEEASAETLAVKVSADIYIAPEHFLDLIALLVRKTRDYPDLFPNTEWVRISARLDEVLMADAQAPTE